MTLALPDMKMYAFYVCITYSGMLSDVARAVCLVGMRAG